MSLQLFLLPQVWLISQVLFIQFFNNEIIEIYILEFQVLKEKIVVDMLENLYTINY